MNEEGQEPLGAVAIKPPGWDRQGFQAFKFFLYDPDSGAILSRTPVSWAKIIGFYFIFYCCLAIFWAICFAIFMMVTLPENDAGPKLQLDSSVIGKPGLKVFPSASGSKGRLFSLKLRDKNEEVTNPSGEGTLNVDYARRAELFLEHYKNDTKEGYEKFDLGQLGDCGKYPYGYYNSSGDPIKPCIFLKLNKIWGWSPPEREPGIRISCEGQLDQDKKALGEVDNLSFSPASKMMDRKYFPFKGFPESYHSPLVAIQFQADKMAKKSEIHVECRTGYVESTDFLTSIKFSVLFEVEEESAQIGEN